MGGGALEAFCGIGDINKTFLLCNIYPQTPWSLVIQVLTGSLCNIVKGADKTCNKKNQFEDFKEEFVNNELKTVVGNFAGSSA